MNCAYSSDNVSTCKKSCEDKEYVVEWFHYLGDTICPRGGCEQATSARTRAAWGKFCELLPLLTSTTISLARHAKLHDSCVRGTLPHASECWPLQREKVQCLLCNERAMLCWMLKIKAKDNVSLSTMYGRLNLAPLESKLRLKLRRFNLSFDSKCGRK